MEECKEHNEDDEIAVCYVTPFDADALHMAIRALEMQKELAEYSGMDICQFVEDYDYEENDISEYEYEDSVDNFLIGGGKENND